MKQIILKSNLRFFLIITLLLLTFVYCDDEKETPFPYVRVDAYLSLDTQLGNMLVGTFKEVDGYGLGGLIIYREDHNKFLAFDKACTYEASSSCVIQEDAEFSGVFECPCCESEFWMVGSDLSGTIKQGPASVPLKQYNCSFNGVNTVRVTN